MPGTSALVINQCRCVVAQAPEPFAIARTAVLWQTIFDDDNAMHGLCPTAQRFDMFDILSFGWPGFFGPNSRCHLHQACCCPRFIIPHAFWPKQACLNLAAPLQADNEALRGTEDTSSEVQQRLQQLGETASGSLELLPADVSLSLMPLHTEPVSNRGTCEHDRLDEVVMRKKSFALESFEIYLKAPMLDGGIVKLSLCKAISAGSGSFQVFSPLTCLGEPYCDKFTMNALCL